MPGTTPAYSMPGVNITPTVGLVGPVLNIGPTANQVDFTGITPWRTPTATPVTVTLATAAASVGIGALANPPTSKLHVDGYTKLGATAPAIQVQKFTSSQTSPNSPGTTSIPLSPITGSKVLAVSVMVEVTNGGGTWIPPDYINSPGLQYTWQLSGNNIDVINVAGNSGFITGRNIRILVTYEQ
jgi:hypothetical protein